MTPPVAPVTESVSPDGKYRYRLGLAPSDAACICLFLMLNPSTREERIRTGYHLTRERCKALATARRYGTLVTSNLFAYWCSGPSELCETNDPVGQPENDRHIRAAVRRADLIVCAWGDSGRQALPTCSAIATGKPSRNEASPLCRPLSKSGSHLRARHETTASVLGVGSSQ